MTTVTLHFKQEPSQPEVWSCECGSQEWLLRPEGGCVCAGCLMASKVIRVMRVDHEIALRGLFAKIACTCGATGKYTAIDEHGSWCRYRTQMLDAGLSEGKTAIQDKP